MSTISNIYAVARREFITRARTRTFVLGTALLVVGVVAIALAPVIVRYIDRSDAQQVGVWTGAADIGVDPVSTIAVLLNAPSGSGGSAAGTEADFDVTSVPDLAAARAAVTRGDYDAVLAVERGASGDLQFTLYTNDSSTGRVAQLIRQASTTVAIGDRLARLGVAPADQPGVFAPARFGVEWPDPARTGPTRGSVEQGANDFLGFGMTILIFMMVIMYGNWVAMSVVEEKSSRVMEVILNAATPFQLLSGKVLGVGAVALAQYAAIIVAGGVALVAQGPVASFVLGTGSSDVSLPAGLTFGMLVLLVVYGVLGFLLYAVLYAAAGSLVSRTEDVNAAVMPLTLVSTGGYLVAVYAATGLLDIRGDWMTVLSQIPFLSPFMMLSRVTAGGAAVWEIPLSIAILVVSIVAALWIAARIYAAGVLLYGQRPGVRALWRLVRAGM
jgi:ABC-2 type transport system permease protein